MSAPRTILVVGLPRSATTWVGSVLALGDRVQYVHEPDNEKVSLLGLRYKRDVPRFPDLPPGRDAPRYRRLWEIAAASPRAMLLSRSTLTRICKAAVSPLRDPLIVRRKERRMLRTFDPKPGKVEPPITIARDGLRIIKTVHGVLCVEWITDVIPVDRVVVTMRHPLAILASWRRMKMADATRPYTLSAPVQRRVLGQVIATSNELQRQALHLAVLFRGLEKQAKRHGEWIIVAHERLCLDPIVQFRALYKRVGLPFTPAVEQGIVAHDRAGRGFSPLRVAAREIDKWKKDYSDDELKQATAVFEWAGLKPWLR